MMEYIRFTFKNEEPLRIADDSTSESGQINTLYYVPGSALRGAVVNAFVQAGELDEYKEKLLSGETAFLNAYIIEDEKELIPSFKGFYEDKTDAPDGIKQIENVLAKGKTTSGLKRASLGRYCYPDGDCICYTGIRMGSDMKINKGRQEGVDSTVLRNQYIEPGYRFAAYIAVPDYAEGLSEKIKEVIERMRNNNSLVLGGSRSFGYGKCGIQGDIEVTTKLPYEDYAQNDDTEGQLYMALLSDITMINDSGEMVGIDPTILGEELGVKNLTIEACATSVVDVRGYNRTWQTWLPSSKMYEKGSVFKLNLNGEKVSAKALKKLMNEGVGIRIGEGYGRVIFLKDFDKLTKKKEINAAKEQEIEISDIPTLSPDEEHTLRIAAKGYYMNCIDRAEDEYLSKKGNKEKLSDYKMKNSQWGAIESILYKNLYTEDGGFEELLTYLEHARKKDEDQKILKEHWIPRGDVAEYIVSIRDKSLSEIFDGLPESVMGIKADEILTSAEVNRIKQQLIISEIKLLNRKRESKDEQSDL